MAKIFTGTSENAPAIKALRKGYVWGGMPFLQMLKRQIEEDGKMSAAPPFPPPTTLAHVPTQPIVTHNGATIYFSDNHGILEQFYEQGVIKRSDNGTLRVDPEFETTLKDLIEKLK